MKVWRGVLRSVTVVTGKLKLWLVGTELVCWYSRILYTTYWVTREVSLGFVGCI